MNAGMSWITRFFLKRYIRRLAELMRQVRVLKVFDEEIQIPDDLRSQIEKSISGTARSWDSAVKRLAANY